MQFGDFRIEVVPDTEFRLDGGAMFGVVPRVLWEKFFPPDESNRIQMQSNCLFVEASGERILIETGMGEKWTDKQTKMYAVKREKPFAETLLEKTGYAPEQITIVVNTHLHFDHCGGNTRFDANNKIAASFPNARYFVSASEFAHAVNPTLRDKGSYIAHDFVPLQETGQLELKPDIYEVVPNLTMRQTRGHNGTMQTAEIRNGNQTLYHFADLIPTTAHLALPWIMGYDLFPLETLENKQKLLPQAVAEDWLCFFYHDPNTPLCRLREENGKIKAVEI